MSGGARVGRLAAGLGLLALALLLPAETIAHRMVGSTASAARVGLTIYRICLALEGLLVALGALLPADWFRGPLPRSDRQRAKSPRPSRRGGRRWG
jgi:hypothetical protein